MKQSIFSLVAISSLGLLFLCSVAVSPDNSKNPQIDRSLGEKIVSQEADGKAQSLKYRDLKEMAEEAKGEKLTLKQKIGLRVFGKKIKDIKKTEAAQGEKSQLIALILAWVVGVLGIHRFYLGYTWQGVVQLLTGGGCGIWVLIDFIRIAMGTLTPKDGAYDKTF